MTRLRRRLRGHHSPDRPKETYCYSTYFIHTSMLSARLAHQQSAPPTPERQEGQHLHWVLVPDPRSEGPGRDPGMSGGGTRQAPRGRAHAARKPGRNPVAPAVQVRLLPRPLHHDAARAAWPGAVRDLPGSGLCPRVSEARSPQFDSGQGGSLPQARPHAREVREPPAKRSTPVRFRLRSRLLPNHPGGSQHEGRAAAP
jgi:hypothetical protein